MELFWVSKKFQLNFETTKFEKNFKKSQNNFREILFVYGHEKKEHFVGIKLTPQRERREK